jgi:sec-independent protein translocase protein TatC
MADSHDDDLFKNTSMTFGEHLEELRASLFKAVLSLAVGFCIGLWFAPLIVQGIQSPLEHALKKYYSQEAIEYVNARLPADLRNDESMQKLVLEDGLVPQEAFVAPGEMLAELRKKYPKQIGGVDLPPARAAITPAESSGAPSSDAEDPDANSTPAAPRLTKDDLLRIFIWRPLSDDERLKVKNFNVQESFMIYIKAALLFGALISSPLAFYFLWSFVAAGLYPHEKKYVHLFLPVSVGLFLAGAALAFFFVFPPVLNFFFGITKSMGQGLEPRISEWLSFVLLLPLGFGISFQLPLLMLFLARIHVFSVQMYLSKWRIAVLLMAIASMVLSPGGDPYSMLMMLVPLIGLYFSGIALCKWLPSDRGTMDREANERAYAGTD